MLKDVLSVLTRGEGVYNIYMWHKLLTGVISYDLFVQHFLSVSAYVDTARGRDSEEGIPSTSSTQKFCSPQTTLNTGDCKIIMLFARLVCM